jgi:hypothetical protein
MACSLVITGNPGTGKTTFARLLGRFMHAYGLLPKDAFVEKNALELKGAYLGQVECTLCTMHYALCTMHYALCTMHYALCTNSVPLQTAPKVKEAFEQAMGGVLFLDEAYALGGGTEGGGMGGTDKFGAEAIRTLLTEVENNRTDVMVILAGYIEQMEGLLDADPGLRRRFPRRLHLQDYDGIALGRIGHKV